ncbi:hypothetical protein ABTD78_20960, partial [Acinetobacter baumannii]
KKGAPDAAKDSLNLCRKEGKGKTRCAQTVSLPFSSLQQKFKAPQRAGKVKGKKTNHLGTSQNDKGQPREGWPFLLTLGP